MFDAGLAENIVHLFRIKGIAIQGLESDPDRGVFDFPRVLCFQETQEVRVGNLRKRIFRPVKGFRFRIQNMRRGVPLQRIGFACFAVYRNDHPDRLISRNELQGMNRFGLNGKCGNPEIAIPSAILPIPCRLIIWKSPRLTPVAEIASILNLKLIAGSVRIGHDQSSGYRCRKPGPGMEQQNMVPRSVPGVNFCFRQKIRKFSGEDQTLRFPVRENFKPERLPFQGLPAKHPQIVSRPLIRPASAVCIGCEGTVGDGCQGDRRRAGFACNTLFYRG